MRNAFLIAVLVASTLTPVAARAGECAPAPPMPPASTLRAAERAAAHTSRIVRVYANAPMPTPPAVLEGYEPGPDDPATPPAWVELVAPIARRGNGEAKTDTTFRVGRGVTLTLSNFSGDISVQGWKRDEVHLLAQHGRRDRIFVRLRGTDLDIEAANRQGVPAFVDYTLRVPEWMALRLSGLETDISVKGVQAAIQAECMRGDVTVDESRGPLQLSSVEGEVFVRGARGDVQAASVNNGVHLERVFGPIVVESVNGDIRMRQVDSDDVEASSVSGSVTFSGVFQPRGRYRLVSHTGNLQVGVPVGAGIDVTVASFNGAFQSGFPVKVGPRRKGRPFNFTLGSGGSTLELESFQGLIQLMRPSALRAPLAPLAPKAPADPEDVEDK